MANSQRGVAADGTADGRLPLFDHYVIYSAGASYSAARFWCVAEGWGQVPRACSKCITSLQWMSLSRRTLLYSPSPRSAIWRYRAPLPSSLLSPKLLLLSCTHLPLRRFTHPPLSSSNTTSTHCHLFPTTTTTTTTSSSSSTH